MRFITEDTNKGDVKDPLSLNLYTYCQGNPVKLVDIDGHAPTILSGGTTPYITLFRAVSEAEYTSLMETGKFSTVDGATNAKYFAESYENAIKWGNKFHGEGNFRVIKIRVPIETANNSDIFYRFDYDLDTIGPARTAEVEDLNKLGLVIERATEKDKDINNGDMGNKYKPGKYYYDEWGCFTVDGTNHKIYLMGYGKQNRILIPGFNGFQFPNFNFSPMPQFVFN